MLARLNKKPSNRGGNTASRIFSRLIEAIVNGTIPSGLPFREAQFAKRWGVSRTPMREAVRRAAESGFVILRRNRAPIIRSFSPEEITSLYELRELLECYAFKLSFGRIPQRCLSELQTLAGKSQLPNTAGWIERCLEFDRRLHLSWIENCRNPWLAESLIRIWIFIQIIQRYMAGNVQLVKRSAREHRQILAALLVGDKRQGLASLGRHIRNSRQAVVKAVAN